jgi:replicative DNA helicase
MNATANDDTFKPDNFPSASDVFDTPNNNDVPF